MTVAHRGMRSVKSWLCRYCKAVQIHFDEDTTTADGIFIPLLDSGKPHVCKHPNNPRAGGWS